MKKVVNFPNEQSTREQAGMWIARLDRELSAEEQLELQQWLGEDVRHRAVLFEMAKLWDRMNVMSEIAGLFPLERRSSNSAWRYARPATVCSLIVVAVCLGVWGGMHRVTLPSVVAGKVFGQQKIEATYQTAIGRQRSVMLPDRSIITLNTATLLRVHYTGADRKIELIEGEAHFEVAKGDSRVFTVQVGDNEFKAVGTAFNIRVSSERGVQLTVTEGRVKVVVPSKTSRVMSDTNQIATEIMIDAGKEVAVGKAAQTVENLSPEKVDAIIAWKRGMVVFDGEPLEQAIREVGRYSHVDFVIADETIRKIPVSGYFKIGDIDGLVAALVTNFNIDADKHGESIILSAHR